MKKVEKHILICKHCSKEKILRPCEVKRYSNGVCSIACRNELMKLNKSINPNYRGGSEQKCQNCNNAFYVKPSHKIRRKTCSKKCATELMVKNEVYVGDKNPCYRHGKTYDGYYVFKRKTNIQYKLASNLRARIYSAIKGNAKRGSAVRDLGCSIAELKSYLEAQFKPGMSWDNWTKDGWHIDHITPLKKFNLEDVDQFKKAVHYTNLQPLWAKENLSKGAK